MQLAWLSLALLVLQLTQLELSQPLSWAWIAATLCALGWHLWWILPYTRVWRVEVRSTRQHDPKRQLSILTANVLMSNQNTDSFLALVAQNQPDVLVTLESDLRWQNALDTLQEEMPYSVKCPLDNLYGMHVYSRLPILSATTAYLVEPNIPSIHAHILLRTGQKVRMHFLHPAPPSPTENPESIQRDAELLVVAQSVLESGQPLVVTGDLNDVAWSATTRLFRKVSGLLDPRIGRGLFNTFHAKIPLFRWPLDHLFHSEHFTITSIRRLPNFGSDHFALFTKLAYDPLIAPEQQGLRASEEELQQAQAITDSMQVRKQDVPKTLTSPSVSKP